MAAAVDRVNFVLTVIAMLGMAIPLMVFPEISAALLQAAYDWLAESLGWFYILNGDRLIHCRGLCGIWSLTHKCD